MNRTILFASEIKDPYDGDFSSTQIMTENLIAGLKSQSSKLIFVGLVNVGCKSENVIDYYGKIADEVYIVYSHQNLLTTPNKYKKLVKTAFGWINSKQYNSDLERLFSSVDKIDLLITHSPSLEILSLAKLMKEHYNVRYIQYWSDPYAITGINPEQLSVKRAPHRLLESMMLASGDEIVYGTKTLMNFQKQVFWRHRNKMRYVDVSYCEMAKSENDCTDTFIYAGDYSRAIRNIIPLYNAFSKGGIGKLKIIGNGNVALESNEFVAVSGRKPFRDVQIEEAKASVIVCLLNKSCIQIPGKIFYRVNTDQNILVIVDGIHGDELKEYLESFDRFVFCENNEESIINACRELKGKRYEKAEMIKETLSPERIAMQLIG